jgi:carbon monoxide dehydrogenase subunit G
MNIEGTYTFQAPIEQVWNSLLDPEILAKALPGIENMRETGPDSYEATMHVGVAAVKGTYSGKVSISDKQQPTHYRLHAEGSGARGFVTGEGTIDLAQHNGTTIATYKGEAQLGGAIAGVGMRVLPGVAKMMINQFFGTIAEELHSQQAPKAAAATTALEAPPELEPTPAGAAASPVSAAPASQPAARATTTTPRGTITLPPVRQSGDLLIHLVRSLKLSDGSAEDEQRWAQRLLFGAVGAVLGIALLGFLFGRFFGRRRS